MTCIACFGTSLFTDYPKMIQTNLIPYILCSQSIFNATFLKIQHLDTAVPTAFVPPFHSVTVKVVKVLILMCSFELVNVSGSKPTFLPGSEGGTERGY